ncbi:MAG TPA: hypothetical protein PLR25_20150 [Planctomycetaceae bacterium]|nr:hypothetical protein [Planctomycetaceae bacterium]
MTTYDSGESRELIAKVCDATLSAAETQRLNEILKSDGIARDTCVDHLFLSGMLEREFAGPFLDAKALALKNSVATSNLQSPSPLVKSKPSIWKTCSRYLTTSWVPLLVVTVLLIAVISRPLIKSSGSSVELVSIPVFESSFEGSRLQLEATASAGQWLGDGVNVVSERDGIEPLDGHDMLHFVTGELSSGDGSDVYQIIDLITWRRTLAEGNVSAVASVHFNAETPDKHHDECVFGIHLYAFSEFPIGILDFNPENGRKPQAHGSRNIQADSDAESWQDVSTSLELPPQARYLVLQLSVKDADGKPGSDFREHFADKVSLNLASSK